MVRTDARPEIGYGHFFRCLALMEAMASAGADCTLAGGAPAYMEAAADSYNRIRMPGGLADWNHPPFLSALESADLLVTDLYEIDAEWQARSPKPVLAIADPPLRSLHCEMLLIPTSFEPPADRAALSAPAYVLLRRAFAARRAGAKTGKRLLISCGGGEDHGLALRTVEAMAAQTELADVEGTVVLGDVSEDYVRRVRTGVARVHGLAVTDHVSDMASMIAAHDIAVGTPAGSALERACLGLAQILVPIADNQLVLGAALAERGAAATLERDADGTAIAEALSGLLRDDGRRAALGATGYDLIDGQGAERVAAIAADRFGK